jgi:hypothetical protein
VAAAGAAVAIAALTAATSLRRSACWLVMAAIALIALSRLTVTHRT